MKFGLLVVSLALSLAGCKAGMPSPANNFDQLSSDVQGSFSNAQLVTSQGSQPFSSCPTPANQIDNRLVAGTVYQTLYESINGWASKRILIVNSQIKTVSPATLIESVSPVSSAGLPKASLVSNAPLTCTTTGDKAGCVEPAFVNLMDPYTGGQYSTCTLVPDSAQKANPAVYSGKYTLSNGKAVDAYKTETDIPGNLICDGAQIAHVTQTTINIVSTVVPAENAITSCGGTNLMQLVAFKNVNGLVIVGSLQERLSVP